MSKRVSIKYRVILIYLALAVVTFIAFEQVRYNDFVSYDDTVYVTGNQHVQKGLNVESFIWAFTTGYAANWHPLTWLSHMLDYQLYGLNPTGHHMTNLLLHILNTLLLFGVLKAMTRALWPSMFVAVLFAIHPLHVESVAWVAERKDVLSTFFWMLTIAAYLRYTKRPCIGSYLLVVFVFALGLMAKPMLVTLPFVLLLLDYWPLKRLGSGHIKIPVSTSLKRLVLEKIPLFTLAVTSSVITYFVQQTGGAMGKTDVLTFGVRLVNALVSYVGYIQKMIYPKGLAVLYPHPQDAVGSWPLIVSILILAVVSAAVLFASRKRRYLATGWFWYLGTLVPVIGLVQVGGQAMADRYTYVPAIGIFIIVGWGVGELFAKWRHRKVVLSVLGGIVIVTLLLCTRMQVRHWRNSLTLYEHTLGVTENNSVMLFNYGICLKKDGRIEEAVEYYRKALGVDPDHPEAHNNLGIALGELGKPEEAAGHYQESLRVDPDHPQIHNNLGNTLVELGKFEQAISYYQEALRIDPDYFKAHFNLGNVLLAQGKLEQAAEHYQEALRIDPDHAKAHFSLGNVLALQGKLEQAAEHYQESLRIDPENPKIHFNLGSILATLGKFEQAVEHYQESLRIDPENPEIHFNLGNIFLSQGKRGKAISHFEQYLKLKPDSIAVLNNVAWMRAASDDEDIRDPAEAVRFAERACELTKFKSPTLLDTLSVAYAASGNFTKAIETAEKALQLIVDNEKLTNDIQGRIELYKAGQSYVEP